MRIAIVAGEASGDTLGFGLIKALKSHFPNASFEGIGGPKMLSEGFQSLCPMADIAVMGLVEVLSSLPELLKIRRHTLHYFSTNPPDIYIGIDAPEFNLYIEKKLKQRGIKTAHYVSPQVWAWRQNRVKKIAESIDLLLTLFPFEAAFYESHDVPVSFVGHPLADEIEQTTDVAAARKQIGVEDDAIIIGVFPGSRSGEIRRMLPVFLEAAARLYGQRPDVEFLLSAANPEAKKIIESMLLEYQGLPVRILERQPRQTIAAANIVLLTSGTITLESLLLKTPMVVAYKLAPLTHAIAKRMVKVNLFSLPNVLTNSLLVPELIQDDVEPRALCEALLTGLENPQGNKALQARFMEIHAQLRQNASVRAAEKVAALIQRSP